MIRSDGTYLRDYFYVKDGAAAYLHLAECLGRRPELAGHAFNFSTETPLSVLQIVQRIMRQLEGSEQSRPTCAAKATKHEIKHQYLSAAKEASIAPVAAEGGVRTWTKRPRRSPGIATTSRPTARRWPTRRYGRPGPARRAA